MNNIYYVYMYLREDGTPYYIGQGKGRRAQSTHRRVPVPKNKSNIRFIIEDISEDEAFMWEELWIDFFGRKDLGTGCLRNMSAGGEGTSGKSEETRAKLSAANIGNKNALGHILSEEAKEKISSVHRNKRHSEETKAKMRNKVRSDELKHRWSIAKLGKKQEIIICPFCSKQGGNSMRRWHFSNCKLKD